MSVILKRSLGMLSSKKIGFGLLLVLVTTSCSSHFLLAFLLFVFVSIVSVLCSLVVQKVRGKYVSKVSCDMTMTPGGIISPWLEYLPLAK